MRIRSLLVSSTVMAGFLITGGFSNEALAQKGVVLAPTTQWAISKVQDAGGAGSYCSMAKRFKRDTVLTIAKNDSSEASLAIDFQRPQFSIEHMFNVVLDPGAGQQRAFEVRPVSDRAFVIRLGQDEEFFGALDRTGHLRLEMGEESYSFNLSDIDTGQFKLDSCVVSLIAPAAGETEGEKMEAVNAAGNNYRQEINTLRASIKALEDENTRLKTAGAPVEATDPSELVSSLTAQMKAIEAEKAKLQAELQAAHENKLTTVRAEDAETESLRAELAALKAEKENLSAELQENAAQQAALKDENKRLQNVVETQSTQFNQASAAPVETEDYRADLEMLQKEMALLTAQNKQKDEELATLSKLSVAFEEAKAENAKLRAQFQEQVQAQSELSGEAETTAALNSKIEDLIAQNAALEAQQKETENLYLAMKAAEEKQDEPVDGISGDSFAANDSALVESMQTLEAENAALKDALLEAQQRANNTDDRAQRDLEYETLKVELAGVVSENKSLNTELEKARRMLQQNQAVSTSAVDHDSRQRIQRLEAALARADIDKQQSMQGLAREYIRLRDFVQAQGGEQWQVLSAASMSSYMPDAVAASDPVYYEQGSSEGELGEDQNIMVADIAEEIFWFDRETGKVIDNSTIPDMPEIENMGHDSETLEPVISSETKQPQAIQQHNKRPDVMEPEFVEPKVMKPVQPAYIEESMTEAQRLERVLKENMDAPLPSADLNSADRGIEPTLAPPPSPESATLLKPVVSPNESQKPLQARMKVDLFDGITVEGEEGAPPVPRIEQEIITLEDPDAVSFTSETAPLPPSVSSIESTPLRAPVEQQPLSPPRISQAISVPDVVIGAGIVSRDGIQPVNTASMAGKTAYQWQNGPIYGSAEQQSADSELDFERYVQDYLERAKSRCTGDFAIIPHNSEGFGQARLDSYDIACIGSEVNSSASLLFAYKNGTFTVFAHESNAEALDKSMNYRDMIINTIRSGSK